MYMEKGIILEWFLEHISTIESFLNVMITIVKGFVLAGGMIGGLIMGFFRLKLKCNQYKYLNLVVDSQIKQAMRYYIPTRGQNIDPCEEEEYATRHSFVSVELVKLFMKEIFKSSEVQYFIILADSGMGKTTFLLKLFFEYYKKIIKKYDIVFVPLSIESSLERIRKVENKSNTILLLDAFDEDKYAMEDYAKRLRKICDETELFYKVVLTCRTQFFPNRESEPKDTGKIKFGVGNKKVEFIKYYISPFNDNDIKKYLKKKYKFFYRKKIRFKAEKLVKRCPRLMMRPMLLNYIDYLINDEMHYEYIYQIYDVLIQKWIERETIPDDILYSFTNKLAILMFTENRLTRYNSEFEKICKDFDLKINPIEAKSRSLLNRTAEGLYKFAHKSIYEYFLAKNALEDLEFRKKLVASKFIGLDMASLFFSEMCENYIKKREYSDLSYMRVSNYHFIDYNFSKCTLEKCTFFQCKISNCSFELSMANGIEFIDCELEDSSFNDSNLPRAVFSGSEIRDCEFINANLEESSFANTLDKCTKIKGKCNFKGARLLRADFSRINFREFSCIKDAELIGINLSGAQLIDIDFLNGKDLSSAILREARLYNCKMDNIIFSGSDFSNSYIDNVFFLNSDFTDAYLVNGIFSNTQFINTSMLDADLRHSQFNNCIFNKTKFICTYFSECELKACTLYQNIFKEVIVKFIIVEECNLDEEADENLNMKSAQFKKEVEEKKLSKRRR